MEHKAEDCALNPEKFYNTPKEVLADNSLTQEQKDKVLHCWEQDELALIRAEGENMPPLTEEIPHPVEVLDQIKEAEKELKEEADGPAAFIASPAKKGANVQKKNGTRRPLTTVREAVGVFQDVEPLQAAIEELQTQGFMRQEISVLAGEDTIQKKLGHLYKRVEQAEDDPKAPRMIFVSSEEMSVAKGVMIGVPLFIAAMSAAGLVVASGGLLLDAIIYAATAGTVGAGVGSMLATFIDKKRAEHLQTQLDQGGILLWVNLRSPALEKQAIETLRKHSAQDVHIHDIPLYE